MTKIETCETIAIHKDIVEERRAKMPKDEYLHNLADFFKIFGDGTRVRILWALNEKELCVCDIAALLEMSQSAISHQLRVLKHSRLVKNRREGKVIFYSLLDDHITKILNMGMEHLDEK
ncbi:MAG: transcriptional regulator [Candidatus Cloacimonadota bacterium]|nr:MAG: transcriptional regulator [Candidatus Cloacimonadota bacterium]PIE77657.1 MAG: transcriptional regulator [Candidatus Delongbacteria bacterium]